ncbi:hypothetical protein HY030_01990 [Candidatus Gottesmanbacteria bacterium]|nr:hypothetical protein [Candidatus Gottesmanbacteria bacterium]
MKKQKLIIKRIDAKEVIKKGKSLNINAIRKLAQKLKRAMDKESEPYGNQPQVTY